MLPVEIERKFTIKYMPNNIESIQKIEQKHIYRDCVCSIRVRKTTNLATNEDVYTHTIKANNKRVNKNSVIELEKTIKKSDYDKLKPFYGSKIIEKYRCIIPLDNDLKAEVDIFTGRLLGLIIAEVEFKSIEQADRFILPNWFKKSVEHRDFSNRRLSTKRREEILSMIDKNQLIDNKNILKEFQKKINMSKC